MRRLPRARVHGRGLRNSGRGRALCLVMFTSPGRFDSARDNPVLARPARPSASVRRAAVICNATLWSGAHARWFASAAASLTARCAAAPRVVACRVVACTGADAWAVGVTVAARAVPALSSGFAVPRLATAFLPPPSASVTPAVRRIRFLSFCPRGPICAALSPPPSAGRAVARPLVKSSARFVSFR